MVCMFFHLCLLLFIFIACFYCYCWLMSRRIFVIGGTHTQNDPSYTNINVRSRTNYKAKLGHGNWNSWGILLLKVWSWSTDILEDFGGDWSCLYLLICGRGFFGVQRRLVWNWSNTMNAYSALWLLIAWCLSTRASDYVPMRFAVFKG